MISNLVILAIPIIIGSIVYYNSFSFALKSVRETNLSLLQQRMRVVDARLNEVSSIIIRISQDARVNSLMKSDQPPGRTDMMSIYFAIKNLRQYKPDTSFVRSIYVFYKESGIAINPDYAYVANDFFYDFSFRYEDLSESEWRSLIFSSYQNRIYMPASTTFISDRSYDTILCLQSLPIQFPNQTKAVIAVFLDVESFIQLFEPLVENGGFVFVTDKSGSVIMSANTSNHDMLQILEELPNSSGYIKRVISEDKMNISYTTSENNGWTYVTAIPERIVMSDLAKIRDTTILITAATLLFGLFISYYLAYRNSRPIKELIKNLRGFLGRDLNPIRNEYEFLNINILKLIEKNTSLAEKLNKQNPLLKAAFFDCALRGGFSNEDEFRTYMAYSGINIKGNLYIMAIFKVLGYSVLGDHQNFDKTVLFDVINENLESIASFYDIERDKFLVMIGLREAESKACVENLREHMENIYYKLKSKYSIAVLIAIGGVHDKLIDINHSYEEARIALSFGLSNNKEAVLFFTELEQGVDNYYYPIEMEGKIMNMVRTGNIDDTKKYLSSLYKENYIDRQLSQIAAKHLFNEVRATFNKLYNQIPGKENEYILNLKNDLSKINDFDDAKKLYKYLSEGFVEICRVNYDQMKSHNQDLKLSILEYINNNYTDPNLCLSSMAVRFSLSEVYLSQFFKEQTGENFSLYIENKRIRKASSLLKETEKIVYDIACDVGYNSSDTFRKAFKRITGLSPAQHRKLSKNKNYS